MRKIMLAALAASLSLAGCVKDRGNYDYSSADAQYPALLPDGSIEPTYDRKAGEQLVIDPHYAGTVDDSNYEYAWFVEDNQGKRDTLSRTLKIDWKVALRAGTHNLWLKVTNRKNEVSRHYNTKLIVITDFTEGWFVTKAIGDGNSDIDLVSFDNTQYLPNIFAMVNGYNMEGDPVRMIYDAPLGVGGYEWIDPLDYKAKVRPEFTIATTKEVHTVEANEMTAHYANGSAFIGAPSAIAPQELGAWIYGFNHLQVLVNNGKIHWMAGKNGLGGGAAGHMGQFTEAYFSSAFDLHSSVCKVFGPYSYGAHGLGLFFDKAGKTFKILRSASMAVSPSSALVFNDAGKLTDYDLVWMKEMGQARGVGLLKATADGKFYSFATKDLVNTPAAALNTSGPIEGTPALVEANSVFVNATVRTTHLSNNTVYCSKGDNQVWAFLPGSGTEQKLLDLPSGESVAFIKHLQNDDTTAQFDYLTVLSNTAEGWKLRCYEFKGVTWELNSTTAVKEYSGTGTAHEALYRGRGDGKNDF